MLGALHLPGWSSYLHPVGPHLVLGLGQTMPGEVMIGPAMPSEPSGTTTTPTPVPLEVPPEAVSRAKATLFDISDPTHPSEVGTVAYPAGSVPLAATQPHQVTWLPESRTLLTVIGSASGVATDDGTRTWLSILTVGDGGLVSRLLRVTTDRPDQVRTVPTADGRVVLVAGDSVEFVNV